MYKNMKITNAPKERNVMQSAERISYLVNLVQQGCWRDFRKEQGDDITVLSVKEQNEDIKNFFDMQIMISPVMGNRYAFDALWVYSFVKEYKFVFGSVSFVEILEECSELRDKFFKLKSKYQKLFFEDMDERVTEEMKNFDTIYHMFAEPKEITVSQKKKKIIKVS